MEDLTVEDERKKKSPSIPEVGSTNPEVSALCSLFEGLSLAGKRKRWKVDNDDYGGCPMKRRR